MVTQADKDWEDYQLGQQGTPTGSLYNQMGLNDRPQQTAAEQSPIKPQKRKEAIQKKSSSSSTTGNPSKNNTANMAFSPGFAAIAFIATVVYLYEPSSDSVVPSVVAGGIAAILMGKFYKPILTILATIAVLAIIRLASQ